MGEEEVKTEEITTPVEEDGDGIQDLTVNDDIQELAGIEEVSVVARLSSLLFVATRPLSFNSIKQAVNASAEEVEAAIEELKKLFRDEQHGFSLHEVASGFQFRTAPGAAATIKRYRPPRHRRISRAAAETLAIIAYKQPVQRAEIENIRGVDALPTLKTLLENKLIRVVGHEASVGQPALYATTQEFLEVFGLSDLSELPSVRELAEIAQDPGEVEEQRELTNVEENKENIDSSLERLDESTEEIQIH